MSLPRNAFGAVAVLGAVLGAVLAAVFFTAPAAAASADCPAITTPTAAPGEDVPAPDQLACADLRGFTFLQEDLTGADLHGSNLQGVSLVQATLTGADLSGANLVGANFGQADMNGVNLSGAIAMDTKFGQTELKGADLSGANLVDANLVQAELNGADLTGADLTSARLGQADLTNANLTDAVLKGAELIQATLIGADLTGADITGANLTQAESDGNLPRPEESAPELGAGPPVLNADDSPAVAAPSADEPQIAILLLWPAAAIALAWLRTWFGYVARHRDTTPVRPANIVGGVVGVGMVMAGICLAVTAMIRSIVPAAGWTRDAGPLSWLGPGPGEQVLAAAVTFVLGGVVLALTRRRTQERGAPTVGQVAIGSPTPGHVGPEFSRGVRWTALTAAIAGVIDLVVVVVLLVLGGLPASGPWQRDTAAGHLVFVAIATLILFRTAANAYNGNEVATPSGAVFVSGVREPFLWLSGTSADGRPASQALPWNALDRVHLIRVLGTSHPGAAMLSVRGPAEDRPTEFPEELPVTPTQVAALYATLPPEVIVEHSRAPRSD